MSIIENFRNDWHDMRKIDYAREKLLDKEHREVRHEQIFQECWKAIAIYEHEWKIRMLAKKYNVSRKTIRDIVNRKTWTHI